MYINYYLYSSGRRLALQVACATPNKTKRYLPGRHLMRLSTPGIMVRRVCRGDPRKSSGWGFSLLPFPSFLLLENHVAYWKKTRRCGYLSVMLALVLILFIVMYLAFICLLVNCFSISSIHNWYWYQIWSLFF
jgi:hypothetical protein